MIKQKLKVRQCKLRFPLCCNLGRMSFWEWHPHPRRRLLDGRVCYWSLHGYLQVNVPIILPCTSRYESLSSTWSLKLNVHCVWVYLHLTGQVCYLSVIWGFCQSPYSTLYSIALFTVILAPRWHTIPYTLTQSLYCTLYSIALFSFSF